MDRYSKYYFCSKAEFEKLARNTRAKMKYNETHFWNIRFQVYAISW